MPVIRDTWEAELGESWFKASLGQKIQQQKTNNKTQNQS
jgi:hypothetical protein